MFFDGSTAESDAECFLKLVLDFNVFINYIICASYIILSQKKKVVHYHLNSFDITKNY